jgi:nitroreductase
VLRELIRKNRSYRRFYEDIPVSLDTLRELVDLARLSASAANAQPLKFALICDPITNMQVFESLAWAAYLKEWDGPAAGERPSAYIIILGDKTIRQVFGIDPGIAAQSILLGAAELGLGGCILASIKKDALRATLHIPEQFEILFVIALGTPREQVVLDDVGPGGNIEYWRDEAGVHHVPKRSLADVIVNLPKNRS